MTIDELADLLKYILKHHSWCHSSIEDDEEYDNATSNVPFTKYVQISLSFDTRDGLIWVVKLDDKRNLEVGAKVFTEQEGKNMKQEILDYLKSY